MQATDEPLQGQGFVNTFKAPLLYWELYKHTFFEVTKAPV